MDEQLSRLNGNVRAEMARKGYTQNDLAKRAGMSQPALSRRLTGDADWTIGELYDVASALGIALADMLPEAAA